MFKMISIIFFNGTLVNKDLTSKVTKINSSLISSNDTEFILPVASKKLLTSYSSCVNGFNNDIKNFLMPW